MCYTAKDSLNAYVFNIISSIVLFFSSKSSDMKIIALFFGFVGQMQLFDYLFWTNSECNKTNKITTKLAIIFNHLQPIILFLLNRYYQHRQSVVSSIIVVLYTIFAVVYTIKLWPDDNCQHLPNNSVCCSLPFAPGQKDTVIDWRWNTQINKYIIYSLFMLSLTTSSFDLQAQENKILLSLLSVGSFFISTKIPKLNESVGRIWCHIAALIPGFIVLFKSV